MLYPGIWHDFPHPFTDSMTCFTINSNGVVSDLVATNSATNLFGNDILKLEILSHHNKTLETPHEHNGARQAFY